MTIYAPKCKITNVERQKTKKEVIQMPMKISMSAARINAGLKQEDVAEKLGISRDTIRGWENGKRIPRVDHAYALAAIYGLPIDAIKFF